MNKTEDTIKTIAALLLTGRFLRNGETIQEDDICIGSTYCWPTMSAGSEVNTEANDLYFRLNKEEEVKNKPLKIRSSKKYRILKPNEIIQKGDQWYNQETRGWKNASKTIGETVKASREYLFECYTRVRRPV
jgi:hypothetical protein